MDQKCAVLPTGPCARVMIESLGLNVIRFSLVTTVNHLSRSGEIEVDNRFTEVRRFRVGACMHAYE